jgi:hypothetical protein
MEQDNTYIRFDWAMKHMLRDKANFGILEGLITVLLGEEVKILELLESESNQDSDNDKFNRVDIKAKNSKGCNIIVIIQFITKLNYYLSLYNGSCTVFRLNDFNNTGCLKKIYSINILACDFGIGNDYAYHGDNLFTSIKTNKLLHLKTIEKGLFIPHLPKQLSPEHYILRLNFYNKIPESPLDEWMIYLKTGIVKEDTLVPSLQEIRKKLPYYSLPPKEKRAYDAHMDTIMVQNDVLDTAREEGRALGRKIGFAQGRAECCAAGISDEVEKGKEEAREFVATKLIELEFPTETIAQITGLPLSQIDRLR